MTDMNRMDISGKIRTVLAGESTDKDKVANMSIYCRFAKELGLSKLELSMIAKRIEEMFGIKLPDMVVNNMDRYTLSLLTSVVKYEIDWGEKGV